MNEPNPNPTPNSASLLRRALYMLGLVWLVGTLVFLLSAAATRPPTVEDAEGNEHLLPCLIDSGADGPLLARYLRVIGTGGLGARSWRPPDCRPVRTVIGEALPPTLALATASLLFAWPAALMLGTWQATRPATRIDAAITAGAVSLHAVPSFLIALVLQLSAMQFGLATTTSLRPGAVDLMLPATAFAIVLTTGWIRPVRTAVVEALALPHVEAARARGLPESHVLRRHVLPHALRPIIILAGLSTPRLVAGSVIIERIFGWPGMGRLFAESAALGDAPMLVAGSMLIAACIGLGDLLASAAVARLDPRFVVAT